MPQIMGAIFAVHVFIHITNLLLYLCIISAIIYTVYIYGTVHLQLHISTRSHAWLGAIQRVAALTNTHHHGNCHAWRGNSPRMEWKLATHGDYNT